MQLDDKAYSFIQTAKQNGWDKNEVMSFLQEKGYDMGLDTPTQPVKAPAQPDPYSGLEKAKYFGRAAGEGALLGTGDMAAGYTNVLANDAADITQGKDLKTRAKGYGNYLLHTLMPATAAKDNGFNQGRNEFIAEQKAFGDVHPWLNLGGEMLGGLVTGALGAGKKLAATAGKQGLKALAGEGAREGAKFTGAYGFGSGLTSEQDKLSIANALKGGAGGVLGGAILGASLPVGIAGIAKGAGVVGKGLGRIGRVINSDFAGQPTQEAVAEVAKKAPQVFVNEWGEIQTPKALQRLLDIDEKAVQQAAKEGVPLIDLADQKMLGTASGVRLASPEAEQIFTTYGRERMAGQHPKIVTALKQYFGDKGSHQLLDELNADVQKGAKVLYDRAVYQLDNAGNVLLDNAGKPVGKVLPELEKLNKYELDYVGKVYGTRGLEYEVGGLPQNDMRVLNYAKQLMDDDIQRLTNQGHNNQARILSEKRAAFIEKIDKANPEYKTARSFFERGKRAEEALQAGKKALKGERSNLEYDFNQLTPEEQEFYRKGVGNALEEMSNMQASGGNPAHKVFGEETLRRLKQLGIKDIDQLEKFARAESKASSNIQRLLQGSPTAEREMQAAREVGGELNVGGALTSPKRTFKRSVANAINKQVKRIINDTSEQDRVEIARLLTDPKYLADQVNELNRLRNAGRANLESIRAGRGAINKAMQEQPSQGSIVDALKSKLKEEGGYAWKDLPAKYTATPNVYENIIDVHTKAGNIEKAPEKWLGKTLEEAKKTLGFNGKKYTLIKTPIEDININEGHLQHLLFENPANRREKLLYAVGALKNPNIITKTNERGHVYHNYIKLYKENDSPVSHMQIVKVKDDGNFYVTNFEPTKKQVEQKIKEGQIVYDLSNVSSSTSKKPSIEDIPTMRSTSTTDTNSIAKKGQNVKGVFGRISDILKDKRGFVPNPIEDTQMAYHGSPVKGIKQFDTAFMGTGEGPQAHGWGSYFSSRKTAEGYRQRLSSGKKLYKGKPLENLRKQLEKEKQYEKAALIEDISLGVEDPWATDEIFNWYDKEIAPHITENKGQLYETKIPKNDVLLDEQKTFNKQPKKVQEALRKMAKDNIEIAKNYTLQEGIDENLTGGKIYNLLEMDLKNTWRNLGDKSGADPAEYVSKGLNEYGIKGITYDGVQDGRSFVIFNPMKDTKINRTFYSVLAALASAGLLNNQEAK